MKPNIPKGYMPIPTIEVVEVPFYISTRSAWEVKVNGNRVTIMPDKKSAVEWSNKLQSWIGL